MLRLMSLICQNCINTFAGYSKNHEHQKSAINKFSVEKKKPKKARKHCNVKKEKDDQANYLPAYNG